MEPDEIEFGSEDRLAKKKQLLPNGKKPYGRPAFQYERVFETMALACLKANNGVPHCQGGSKTS
jgi:hypothetical protein